MIKLISLTFISVLFLACSKSRIDSLEAIAEVSNVQPPPVNLSIDKLPVGTKFHFKNSDFLTAAGTDKHLSLATYKGEEGKSVSIMECYLRFETVLWERKIEKEVVVTIEEMGTTAKEADGRVTYKKIKVSGIKTEDFPNVDMVCSGTTYPNGTGTSFWTGWIPSTQQLACIADIKILLPEGKTNPPVICKLP